MILYHLKKISFIPTDPVGKNTVTVENNEQILFKTGGVFLIQVSYTINGTEGSMSLIRQFSSGQTVTMLIRTPDLISGSK